MFAEGRTSIISSSGNKERVDAMIKEDRRIKMRDIAKALDMSIGIVHHIIYYLLEYRKVSARWVPRQLTPDHFKQRMGASLQYLPQFHRDGNSFLSLQHNG